MTLIRTLVARCDHFGCLAERALDADGAEGVQPYRALVELGWANENTSDAILIYCPDHNTQEKRNGKPKTLRELGEEAESAAATYFHTQEKRS